jgi:hypothetical protein
LKKLIQLLAVSAGGGLLLGAGLKLGERRREGNGAVSADEADRIDLFLTRLEALERRIDGLQMQGGQAQAGAPVPQPASQAANGESSGHRNRESEIEAQFAAMEARLRRELGLRSEDGIGLVARGIERRIEERIGPLEAELASQRSSITELKEYSLRTERSVQKLLEGVDRLVAAQAPLG